MKNILMLSKKEFIRFFGDIRLVISIILLPGLMIYFMYSFIGQKQNDQALSIAEEGYSINVINCPDEFFSLLETANFQIKEISKTEIDISKEKILDNSNDLLISFPQNFTEQLINVLNKTSDNIPHISIYYNSINTKSLAAYETCTILLDSYESAMVNAFNINELDQQYDLADETSKVTYRYAMMLPTFLVLFVFLGCTQTTAESIAGEKDRGTLASLMNTPIECYQIVFGKAISLSIIALLCGLSGFTGSFLSLPYVFGINESMSFDIYSLSDILLALISTISVVILIESLIMLISTISKNVREAQAYIVPVMLLMSIVSMMTMFTQGSEYSYSVFLIPIYNVVLTFGNILLLDFTFSHFIITIVANLIYAGILYYISIRLLENESIVYPH